MAYLLHHLLRDSAARDPHGESVRCEGRSLEYGELDAASNAVAWALIDAGVQPGDRVAVCMTKRVEVIACVYGALKAGAAYVPLDPKAPIPRSTLVADDCAVAAVLTTSLLANELIPSLATPPRLTLLTGNEGSTNLDGPVARYDDVVARGTTTDPDVQSIDSDLAYILYTSGSTGMPKGVMLSHRNALTFVEWCARRIGVSSKDRLSNHAPLHFDLSVFDLYLAAHGGATVVLVPEQGAYFGASLAEFINRERITVWYSVPTALRLLTKVTSEPGAYPSLRTVVFAGEVYPTPALRELRRLTPDVELWNLYGPTETNVCTYYKVDDLPEDDRTIPIGRGCENTEVFAVVPDGRLAGVGEEGELYVRGATVMKGYWGRPDKTAEVLVSNPTRDSHPDLVYRTGDLVKLRADGNYDFLGRRDHQIKSRGYRIELGEIEAALAAHPALDESVVVAVPHEAWGAAIIAWVTLRDGQEVSTTDVKRHVAERLPRYMVPAVVEILDTLPKTSTGKVDRPLLVERATGLSVKAR
jgi:amino acid adenylation domain-containing protein